MAIVKKSPESLKVRVNTCLSRLSDRDTVTVATNELESIVRGLSNESFVPFLNCLSATDSSEKPPVRRQCVRMFGILSAIHGDSLSPHVSRMISVVLRRIRDPDTAVRSACVEAVSSITTYVTQSPFSTILKPFIDALFQEQDMNAQIGVSLCLSAAVEAAAEVDGTELKRVLPRILKLIKMDCFKAKSALLIFIGTLVQTGCVKGRNLRSALIAMATEFLSSEDWAARKAAAEVLQKVAMAEKEFISEFKCNSINALMNRRFDKVKVVRETMNNALDAWKEVADESEEATSSKCSSSSSRGQSPVFISKSSSANSSPQTPFNRKLTPVNSRISGGQKGIQRSGERKKALSFDVKKTDSGKPMNSRVVPLNYNDNLDSNVDFSHENVGEDDEFEDFSLISEQLMQIKNQQSNLFELLQRFMGSSQKGMNTLEKRVDGLEKVLDEMSQRIPGNLNSCCIMPPTEFLSSKFWRKTDIQSPNSSKGFPKRSTVESYFFWPNRE